MFCRTGLVETLTPATMVSSWTTFPPEKMEPRLSRPRSSGEGLTTGAALTSEEKAQTEARTGATSIIVERSVTLNLQRLWALSAR